MSGAVGPSLLHTKIQLPPLRAVHIHRRRLTRALQPGTETAPRITLVSAPAGYGKTSCLVESAHQLHQDGSLVAWYALDEWDNSPARFSVYLLDAFRAASPDFQRLLPSPEQIGLQSAIEQILNCVTQIEAPVILLLDDYHLIVESQIHSAISYMVENLPANMRLGIGSRSDPPLQLARLRAQRRIAEIRMADLRFTPDETAQWVQTELGWTPTDDILRQVDEHAEGWAAAVALIMMQQSHADQQAIEHELARYSVSRRHIFDFFMQEVFDQQPDDVREFLLDTCVLHRLHPDLCSALAANPTSALILHRLAHASLFVTPLSVAEPIYRYHHLFEQFLRQYLDLHDPARLREKHRLAALWYAEQGSVVETVHHGLASEDFDFVAQYFIGHAWEILTSRGEVLTIVSWLPHFPDEVLRRHPRLCLYFARAFSMLGNAKNAQKYVHLATSILDDDAHDIQERATLQAIAFNYQATPAALRGDLQSAQRWLDQANALLHAVDGLDRARIVHTDAYLQYLRGDVPKARQAYEYSLELSRQIGHDYLLVDGHYYLGQLDLLAGDLQAVRARGDAVIAQYRSKVDVTSLAMVPVASAYYQQNHVIEAEAILRDAIALARRSSIPDASMYAHMALTDVLLARGEVTEAEANIAQARQWAQGYASPMLEALISASRARIALYAGQLDEAVDWARQYQAMEQVDYQQDYENLTLAEVWMAQGHHAKALALLASLIASAEPAGRMGNVIVAETLRALAYRASAMNDAARGALRQALRLAEPQGYIRVFLDRGEPMLRMLRDIVVHDPDARFAVSLLQLDVPAQQHQHPADALTERELEVLHHVAHGASNQNIAESLVISMGTVKSHIHHIMNKLDARSRTEAVRKARSLNLLRD